MRPEHTNRRLAVCLYQLGNDENALNSVKSSLSNNYRFKNFSIDFYSHCGEGDILKNLWHSACKKQEYEIENDFNYDVCIAVNIDTNKNLINSISIPGIIGDKLYYVSGFANLFIASTGISPDIFFAKTTIFDVVSNFYLAKEVLPKDRKGNTLEETFYYYCKGLKIKTECVNYENSSLFKRTT